MLSSETLGSVVVRLLSVEAQIERMEEECSHDALPVEYDALIERRDAGQRLLTEVSR